MTLYLISWNICGLSDAGNRKLLLQWTSNFERHYPGSVIVFLLQETHTLKDHEKNIIQATLGPNYSSIWSSFNSASNSVCIFTKKENQLLLIDLDSEERMLEGTININGTKFT